MLSNSEIQRNLNFLNYYWADIDGVIGPITTQAIKDFQSDYGLYVDGIWGSETDGECNRVIKNIQSILKTQCDGIIGDITQNALKKYQSENALSADGICGKLTLGVMNSVVSAPTNCDYSLISYFTREENMCHCNKVYCDGYPNEMKHALMKAADEVRKTIGVPIICTSGVRCPQHNKNVGGVDNSKHLTGNALDCYAPSVSGEELLNVFYSKGISWGYIITDDVIHVEI